MKRARKKGPEKSLKKVPVSLPQEHPDAYIQVSGE